MKQIVTHGRRFIIWILLALASTYLVFTIIRNRRWTTSHHDGHQRHF